MTSAVAVLEPPFQPLAAPLRILVVEDSEITLGLLSLLLNNRGYGVCCVRDGEAALIELAENAYDVCIVDFHLPTVSGLEVTRDFRKRAEKFNKWTRFIGMTADIEGLLEHPADCENLDLVFSKPIVVNEMYAAIEKVGRTGDELSPVSSQNGASELVALPPSSGLHRSGGRIELVTDRRRVGRKPVSLTGTTIIRQNGQQHACKIVALSIAGAEFESDCPLVLGESIMVGRTTARVARIMERGAAVEFKAAD